MWLPGAAVCWGTLLWSVFLDSLFCWGLNGQTTCLAPVTLFIDLGPPVGCEVFWNNFVLLIL